MNINQRVKILHNRHGSSPYTGTIVGTELTRMLTNKHLSGYNRKEFIVSNKTRYAVKEDGSFTFWHEPGDLERLE